MKTHSRSDETWRCDACGAFNDELLQVCSECTAKRLASLPRARKKTSRPKRPKSKIVKPPSSKRRDSGAKHAEALETQLSTQDSLEQESTDTNFKVDSPTAIEPEPPASPEVLEENDHVPDVEERQELGDSPDHRSSEPWEQLQGEGASEVIAEPEAAIPTQAPPCEPAIGGEGHYGLVYVNTPVPELIKRRIEIDFDSFPTVSIGRSPENVVVIPDAGVSRVHAELRKEGGRVVLTDLDSSNGTYVYEGKEFVKVDHLVEIGPNTLLKLGTGTILRLVSEQILPGRS